MTDILAIKDGDGNYIPFACPSMDGYTCVPNEIVKASRNTLGNLYKTRINVKRSISVKWVGLSHDEYIHIVQSTNSNSFFLRYWDMQEMALREGKFYRGNDFVPTGYPPFKDNKFAHYDLTMSFEEF